MKKLIIFDLDGVVVDSEHIRCEIDAEILSSAGYPITTENFIQNYSGISDKTMSELIEKNTGIKVPETVFNARTDHMLERFRTNLQPLLKPFIEKLESWGIPRCIASGSPHHRIMSSLEFTSQAHLFNEKSIFNATQVKRGKPYPDIFLHAAQQMGVHPSNCLVIEDSKAGIEAAQAANMEVIAFLGGTHARYNWYKESLELDNVLSAQSSQEVEAMFFKKNPDLL